MNQKRTSAGRFAASEVTERFWPKVQVLGAEECWLWQSNKRGAYGTLRMGSTQRGAHRVSWEIHNGPIPRGMFVCHRCDVPACVNPRHLFLGSQGENMRDKVRKGRHISNPPRGNDHCHAKLTTETVTEIRSLLSAGETGKSVAARFGVTHQNVYDIKNRKTWRHVP